MSWPALKASHTNKRENTIEYRTTYYKNNWGFCFIQSIYENKKFYWKVQCFIDSLLERMVR